MSSLFDLPFEEPEPAPQPQLQTPVLPRSPANSPDEARVAQPPRVARPARPVWSVSELTARLRDTLETTFADVWVEGELSNTKVWNTGHLYFTLKDGSAQVRGVMFRSALKYLRFKPVDGLHVVARGRISVYDPKGEYQLVAEHLEPQGYGALQLAFEQLKKKLTAEGLFDPSRKRPLPALPRRIGIVTSIDGAALRDIVRVLRRRYPNAHLVIAPSRVQGEEAAGEIVRALKFLGRVPGVDVVIVGRGGGSLEDLWAFNEEKVARAIASCPVPVISAVGHETDVTIADFVADVRAATPSAAAELVVRRKDEFYSSIDRLTGRLSASMRGRVAKLEARVHAILARPGHAGYPGRLVFRGRHVAELAAGARVAITRSVHRRARLSERTGRALAHHDPRRRLSSMRAAVTAIDSRMATAMVRRQHRVAATLARCAARLDGLSPLSVLARGYALVWDATRTRLVRAAASVAAGDQIVVQLEDGALGARVTSVVSEPRT